MAMFLVSLGVATALGCLLYGRVLERLRANHERVWSTLGSPALTLPSLLGNRRSMQRFLWSREFEPLGDPVLTHRCEVFRWFLIAFVCLSPVAVVLTSS